jgi:uncharacterized membrane protein YjjP (DUF1212 family)
MKNWVAVSVAYVLGVTVGYIDLDGWIDWLPAIVAGIGLGLLVYMLERPAEV